MESSNPKSRGLGDTIKKITNKLGIRQCAKCRKRQERLNQMVPYISKKARAAHKAKVAEDKKFLAAKKRKATRAKAATKVAAEPVVETTVVETTVVEEEATSEPSSTTEA